MTKYKTTKYKTERGLVQAIRRLELKSPEYPIKGSGYEREPMRYNHALAAILGNTARGNHVATVFARRSRRAMNPMQFGEDQFVVSLELDSIIESNQEMLAKIDKWAISSEKLALALA